MVIVAIYGAKQGWFNSLAPQFNLSNNLPGNNYGSNNPYQVVTQTQQQYITQGNTPLGSSGAACQIALARTSINMGDNLAGQLTSNRPATQVNVYHRLVGEAINPNIITGVTDAQGSWLAFSGQINIPGIYQIAATLNFLSEGIEIACTPIVTVTVHGLLIVPAVSSVAMGSNFQVDVYSDTPNTAIEIQQRLTTNPAWASLVPVGTNAGGHYSVITQLPSTGNWLMRAYNRGSGALSNEAAIYVGI